MPEDDREDVRPRTSAAALELWASASDICDVVCGVSEVHGDQDGGGPRSHAICKNLILGTRPGLNDFCVNYLEDDSFDHAPSSTSNRFC
jgi:hypothetical protein